MHRVTNVNAEERSGDCEECGAGVKVRPRSRDGRTYWSCRYRRPGESKGTPEAVRRRRLRRSLRELGVTQEELDALLERDGDGCAVCGESTDRRLAIDHCHRTGRARGLLCSSCNLGLGNFRDDPALLAAAARYLTR